LQVVGTWQDAHGLSVFIADPSHIVQAHAGDVVFGQYKLTRVTPSQIAILDIASRREFPFPVPQVDTRTNPIDLP
jgi:hypothetical protein